MSGNWTSRDYALLGLILCIIMLATWKFYEILFWLSEHVKITIEA